MLEVIWNTWNVLLWIGVVATIVVLGNLIFLGCLIAVYNFQNWRVERRIKKFNAQIEEHRNELE